MKTKIAILILLMFNLSAASHPQSICDGVGEIRYKNALYVGECKEGMREGKGVLTFDNGTTYDGTFLEDKKNGYGILTYANGVVYEGEWLDDLYDGKGKIDYGNNQSYEGDFKAGRKYGFGIYRYASGAVYEGEWINDEKEGKGIYTDAKGTKYEGEFSANKRHGYGRIVYPNNTLYEGYFQNDLREGEGKLTYADGRVFYGVWRGDKKNGPGREISQYGVCAGIWQDEKLVKITNEITKDEAYSYFNLLRRKAGMIPLKRNTILEKSAKSHSYYIELHHDALEGLDFHYEQPGQKGFTGETPRRRAIAHGYFSNNIGEGISNFCTAKESINSLMTAIYHRFGVLNMSKDEIGLGFTYNPATIERNFVYNSGSSKLNTLCQGDGIWIGYYYEKVCADESLKVKKSAYDEAKASIRKQNPEYVLWPAPDTKENAYFFKNEVPNPMPGYKKTGNPISVAFNPYYYPKTVVMHSFKLFEGTEEITKTKLLTKQTDPNEQLTQYQYALFPLDPLKQATTYRAEFKYEYKGFVDTIKWSFTTME